MSNKTRLNLPFSMAVPLALFLATIVVLAVCPASVDWPQQALFAYLPYLLLGVAALLGPLFTQTRVTYVAVYMGTAALLVHYAFFVAPAEAEKGEVILLLAPMLAACFTALLYRLTERGLFTSHGAGRSLGVMAALIFLYLLPMSPGLQQAVQASVPPAFHTASGWVRIPGLGLVALAAALALLLIRKKGESPFLGPLLAMALLFFFLGLNFQSSLWCAEPKQTVFFRQTVFVLFTSGAALLLISAILESVWQHMNIDELTELPGRRPFKHQLRCLGPSYALAIVDLDHFKQINDTYGHLAGDQVLRFIAAVLARSAAGKVYRYGGEEFAIIYEDRPYEAALADLEQIRDTVSRKTFVIRGADRPARKPRQPPRTANRPVDSIRITVSIGAACSGQRYPAPQNVMEAADQALYRAKDEGRNRVCYAK